MSAFVQATKEAEALRAAQPPACAEDRRLFDATLEDTEHHVQALGNAVVSLQSELKATRARADGHLAGRKQAQTSLVEALRAREQVLLAWMAREQEHHKQSLAEHHRRETVLQSLRSQSMPQ